jgi:hypothetical protein
MSFSCIFCNKKLKSKQGLDRHNNICTQKEHMTLVQQKYEIEVCQQLEQQQKHYETQLEQQREHYETQLEQQQKHYETQLEQQQQQQQKQQQQHEQQIQKMEAQIQKLESRIFEIAKQSATTTTIYNTKTTHNNQKTLHIIQQLADYDLDSSTIEEQLREYFTEEVFEGGPKKIIEMATQLIFTDPETKKPKIICTDLSRKNFKYRNPETGEIEVDPGFQKTHDIVRMPLAQANWHIFKDKFKQSECHRERWDMNNSFIGDRNRFADKLLPSLGNTLK